MEVIINSMSYQERETPDILNASRRQRIAAGAGVTVQEVNALISKFNEMRRMIKRVITQTDETKKKRPRKGSNKRKKNRSNKRRANTLTGLPGGLSFNDLKNIASQFNDQ